ncbi:diguanylate cyclase [Bacillus safensis FO-36b] [Bacillus safensis subsp. safensis]
MPATDDAAESEKITEPSLALWRDAMLRWRANKLAKVGLTIIIIIVVVANVVPMFAKYDYSASDYAECFEQPPSKEHWFGTDDLGRNMFLRTWVGARINQKF